MRCSALRWPITGSNCRPAAQLALDRGCHAPFLARDQEPELVIGRRIVAAVSLVGEDARDGCRPAPPCLGSRLAAGNLLKPGSLLDSVAVRHSGNPGQLAPAWILKTQLGHAADPGYLESRPSAA
jgi:hypothetical protein